MEKPAGRGGSSPHGSHRGIRIQMWEASWVKVITSDLVVHAKGRTEEQTADCKDEETGELCCLAQDQTAREKGDKKLGVLQRDDNSQIKLT